MQRNLKLLAWATLANGMCFSMILPLLAPLIRELALSEIEGGIIVSAGALFMALASVYISKSSQLFTAYRLLTLGFWGMTVTWAIFTLILYWGINGLLPISVVLTLLIFSRASTGAFMAMPQIGLQSYVMQHTVDIQQRTQKMALYGAMNSLGMILGPLATSILLIAGMLWPMWAAIFLLMIFSVFLHFYFQKDHPTIKSVEIEEQVKATSSKVFSIKPALPWLLLGLTTYIAIVTLNMTAGFYIQDHFQLSSKQSAIYFSQCMLVVGLSLMVSQVLLAKVFKLKLVVLVMIGSIAMILGLIIALLTQKIFIFQVSYILFGVSIACLLPAFTTGAAQSTGQDHQVKMAGMCTAIQGLGLIIAPILSTTLYHWSNQLPFYALIFLIAATLVWVIGCIYRQKDNQHAVSPC